MDLVDDSKSASPQPDPSEAHQPVDPTQPALLPASTEGHSDTLSFQAEALIEDRPQVVLVPGSGGFEKDRTVISQRPVAAPHEHFKSLPLADLSEMLEGRQLDHFSVQQIIGGGGMGAVFRGIDQRLDRVVAIKVIPGSKRDVETLRRFQIEAQAAARLDHPNIARVFYVGEAEQWNYIVFEYIDGVNIRDLVELDGPLRIDDAVFYTRQVAEALQHAHEREVVHRDIKPSNILVTPSGMAKLVDMGLARDTSMDRSTRDQTASGVTLGTFDYISPEQARNPRDADVRSDLYSLGCTLFFMLTGNPPFPEGTALQKLLNHGSLPPPDPRGWRDDISDQLYDILMKLMAKRPADRYQKPVELVNDLLLLAEQENLPRSQGPSTITLSPSISQPTLLEAHLPWIVAATVLLGSTIWLHSQISLSTGFAFPAVKFPIMESASSLDNRFVPTPIQPSNALIENDDASSRPDSSLPANSAVPAANSVGANTTGTNSTGTNISGTGAVGTNSLGSSNIGNGTAGFSDIGSKNSMLVPVIDATASAATPPAKQYSIVVSATQPIDVPTEAWEPTLSLALQRLSSQSGPCEIEVRGIASLDRPLEISGFADITIRGSNAEARIEVNRTLWYSLVGVNAAIRVTDAALTLRDLQLRSISTESSTTPPAIRTLIQLAGNSSLSNNNVEFTVQGESPNALYLVSTGDFNLPTRPSQAKPSHASNVAINNCMVRGGASVFRINQSSPSSMDTVQISITNSIVAVSGRVVEMIGATGESGVDRLVRLFCERSSFIAEDGFAQIEYLGQQKPEVGLNRTSQASLYWSKPGVAHIRIVAEDADPAENPDQLTLQGVDNAYDQNLNDLCVLDKGNFRTTERTVQDGQQAGWYVERSTERLIRWKTTPATLTSLIEARPADFQLIPSHFVPGYRTSSNSPRSLGVFPEIE